MRKSSFLLWAIVALLTLGVVAAAVFKAWPLLHPEIVVRAPLDPNCDLRYGSCTSSLPGGGRVSLSIQPRDIPPIQPLELEVVSEGMAVDHVEVDFSGVDMNMGFNRTRLQLADDQRFVGAAMLPVCVRDRMQWEALVLLHTDDGIVAASYRFWSARPGVPVPEGPRE